MKFGKEDSQSYELTFAGFLAVRLMEFDYMGKHFSYHGKKLENAVKRLTIPGGPVKATKEELVVLGQANHDWAEWIEGVGR
jgi:hypothetical protein